jgi:hypothetical protein
MSSRALSFVCHVSACGSVTRPSRRFNSNSSSSRLHASLSPSVSASCSCAEQWCFAPSLLGRARHHTVEYRVGRKRGAVCQPSAAHCRCVVSLTRTRSVSHFSRSLSPSVCVTHSDVGISSLCICVFCLHVGIYTLPALLGRTAPAPPVSDTAARLTVGDSMLWTTNNHFQRAFRMSTTTGFFVCNANLSRSISYTTDVFAGTFSNDPIGALSHAHSPSLTIPVFTALCVSLVLLFLFSFLEFPILTSVSLSSPASLFQASIASLSARCLAVSGRSVASPRP